MTYRTIDANDWIARQPKTVQEAGEARGEELIGEVRQRQKCLQTSWWARLTAF